MEMDGVYSIRHKTFWVIFFIMVFSLLKSHAVISKTLDEQIQDYLRNRIETSRTHSTFSIGDEIIHTTHALPVFYESRIYEPAWSENGEIRTQLNDLIKAIQRIKHEGLRPEDYHLDKLIEILQKTRISRSQYQNINPRIWVDLDLLSSDAFLLLASHLFAGRLNPETIDPEWFANRRGTDFSVLLEKALQSKKIAETLTSLVPNYPGYAILRDALLQYRNIEKRGGWPKTAEGPKMEKGVRDKRILTLRKRLMAESCSNVNMDVESDFFDNPLDEEVRRFQGRYGLDADGVVGPKTLSALNVPVKQRIHQIEINMERWRWLPQDLGLRYILVNMANFDLEVVENGSTVIEMKVIVGKGYRRTPVFSDKIKYLVLNPYWHVPLTIAIKDKLPLVINDPEYFVKQNIRVLQGWGIDAKEIDPKTIDWSLVNAQNFNYRLRQDPGPQNALGRVKFMFPNRFNVYMHDTPSKELFEKTTRTFSSGCIRIEKPLELVEFLLRDNPDWTHEKILAALEQKEEIAIRLEFQIPVHLLYWTAFANREGIIQFRNDIYSRDKRLIDALNKIAPTL